MHMAMVLISGTLNISQGLYHVQGIVPKMMVVICALKNT